MPASLRCGVALLKETFGNVWKRLKMLRVCNEEDTVDLQLAFLETKKQLPQDDRGGDVGMDGYLRGGGHGDKDWPGSDPNSSGFSCE